jgi:electron transfer flavoprotein alpha subunit
VLTGAGPDGRDVAGTLAALLERPCSSTPRGRLGRRPVGRDERLRRQARDNLDLRRWRVGIVTVGPTSSPRRKAASAGKVETRQGDGELSSGGQGRRAHRGGRRRTPIEEARIIVAGGRGVGGEEGFKLVEESRASSAPPWARPGRRSTRAGFPTPSRSARRQDREAAAVPGAGISGAIQHKVGMQTAGTIIGVNRDPDAPIAEFADLVVVGDLFEVGKALLAELPVEGLVPAKSRHR